MLQLPYKQIGLSIICAFFLSIALHSQDFGNALEFDGVDDYVFVGNDSSLHVDQFTLTAWVHPYSYSEPLEYESRMENLEKAGEYWMNISTKDGSSHRNIGEVRVGGKFETQWHYLDSEFKVPLNQWTHVACTYNFDSLSLYINGRFECSKEIPENHTDQNDSLNSLAIGCKAITFGDSIQAQFHGMLDEISIWDTALNLTDIRKVKKSGIAQAHPCWERLVAYYKFDEDRLGASEGQTADELGLNPGYNYGAKWVASQLVYIESMYASNPTFKLKQNYPNPVSGITHIPFETTQAGNVHISIIDMSGQVVGIVANRWFQKGEHLVQWDAENLPPGTYLYKMDTGDTFQVRKCKIVR